MYLPMLLLFFLILGVFITVNQTKQIQELNSNAAIGNCMVSASQLTENSQEQTLLGEINTYRALNNVDHLILDNTLQQSAAWQSTDMLTHNSLSHTDSLGRTTDIRLSNCGYDINNGYGENIADGSSDPTAVFSAWKNDPPHNQILLNPRYNIAGIDMESDSSGKVFWTMDFGSSSSLTTPLPTSNSIITTSPTTVIPINPTILSSISPSSEMPTPTPGPVTADMQIFVKVKINGIGQEGNNNPRHRTRHVTALIFGIGASPVTTGTAFLAYDGTNYFSGVIHLGKLSQSAYFVKLVSDYTLQVLAKPEFQNLIINQVNAIPPVTLYQGDMNGDNVLDINDYNLILPCFQSIPTCANATIIDFTDNGKTDVADYNLLLNSFEVLHGN